MYTCVMVVACLYGYIDKQTDGIDRHRDRHKDMEIGKMMMPHNCLELIGGLVVGCRLVGLLWFSLAQIFASIKKFFNFPNFFHNYLIFNAFQI